MDKFKINSHKLIYHIPRVNDWIKGENIYPVYLEVSTSGSCNHRCTYCALDFMEYRPRFLKTDILKKRLSEMGSLGIKSIMYAGEGEPLLHKEKSRH
jgi:GTP 3',8-cyclase